MLEENTKVAQVKGDYRRRYFVGEDIDRGNGAIASVDDEKAPSTPALLHQREKALVDALGHLRGFVGLVPTDAYVSRRLSWSERVVAPRQASRSRSGLDVSCRLRPHRWLCHGACKFCL